MTHDEDSSKATVAPLRRRARARKVDVEREADSIGAEGASPVGPERAEESLAEPALTLPVSEPAPRTSWVTGLGAFAVVLLVGGSMALFLTREPRFPKVEATPPDSMTVADATAPAPALAPTPATPPVANPAQPPTAVVAPAPAPPRPEPAPPQAIAAPTRPTAVQRSPNPQANRRAASQADLEDVCASLPPNGRARCVDRPLDDADARLADAFDNAVDAGVPWPVLRRYRAVWDSLRDRGGDDPGGVARAYHAMAEELDDISRRRFGPG